MRRTPTTQEYVLSALFALIAAFPLATAAGGHWFSIEPLASLTPSVLQADGTDAMRDGCSPEAVLPGVAQGCDAGTQAAPPQLSGLMGR